MPARTVPIQLYLFSPGRPGRLLAMLLALWLSGCGSWHSALKTSGLVKNISEELPLLRVYSVERKRNYPIADNTPIFVQGPDQAQVAALASQLRVYFLSVENLSVNSIAKPGFVLSLSSGPSGQQGRMTITLADARHRKVFDQLNIEISKHEDSEIMLQRVDDAFSLAAAILAGKS